MRSLIPVLVALALSGCGLFGGERGDAWQMVYATDASGRTVAGDKEALVRAVRTGSPLRVGWGIGWTLPDGRAGGVEHVADAGFVSIYQGEVFAQVSSYLQQGPHADRPDIKLGTKDERFVVMLATTGLARHVMRPPGEVHDERVATFWYTRGPGPATAKVPDRLY